MGKLGARFRVDYRDPKKDPLRGQDESSRGVFLQEYHRRIPADGFPKYAENVWDQIVNNKDLDLPTQQELLAQFRCDEISREVLVAFDEAIGPLENKQADGVRQGHPALLPTLGEAMRIARSRAIREFETEAVRYHKAVYARKRAELGSKMDVRLKALFQGQISAAHKAGIHEFSDAVSSAVKAGQKQGSSYDFADIVEQETRTALGEFEKAAKAAMVEGAPWSDYRQEMKLYQKELDQVSATLRKDEMRRLATRVERWVRSRLGESVGLEFNKLGSGRGGSGAPEFGDKPATEKDLWDRVWKVFVRTVEEAEARFTERARSFDASAEEEEVGVWRLRRKTWAVLRAKVDEEVMEGNILLKLREKYVGL